jgi:cysteine-rich repeat protein
MRRWAVGAIVACVLGPSSVHAVTPAVPGVETTTVSRGDAAAVIPDHGSLVELLIVDAPGIVLDVDVTVHLTHERPSDLDIYLVAPDGKTVTLSTGNGGNNADVFANTTFDDQAPAIDPNPDDPEDPTPPAAACVRNFPFADGEPTGPVQPEGAMAAFQGHAAHGPWALVVVDDQGGATGQLESWSLTVATLRALPPVDPPVTFPRPETLPRGAAGIEVGSVDIPDGDLEGIDATLEVSGLGVRLFDVDVVVDIEHERASDLDLYLTSPSGRRIDLVTDVGGDAVDLYRGTTFDDSAPEPVSDAEIPREDEEGPNLPFVRVIPEGALGAFVGEDPNGTWTLNVVDDGYGATGVLNGWQLVVTAQGPCGNGLPDPGEACDDGNGVNGDGCDVNCTVSACGNGIQAPDEQCDDGNTTDGDGCSSQCQLPETQCDDCIDNDGDGLVDGMDPGCGGTPVSLRKGSLRARPANTKLLAKGEVAVPSELSGPATLMFADAAGHAICGSVGDVRARGGKFLVKGTIAGGSIVAKLVPKGVGTFQVKGNRLDLPGLDPETTGVVLSVGSYRAVAGAPLGRVR